MNTICNRCDLIFRILTLSGRDPSQSQWIISDTIEFTCLRISTRPLRVLSGFCLDCPRISALIFLLTMSGSIQNLARGPNLLLDLIRIGPLPLFLPSFSRTLGIVRTDYSLMNLLIENIHSGTLRIYTCGWILTMQS